MRKNRNDMPHPGMPAATSTVEKENMTVKFLLRKMLDMQLKN